VDLPTSRNQEFFQLMTTFDALGVSPHLVACLAAGGITAPLPIQTATIPDALAGRDICGRAETGSGKTLAFGVPLVERTVRADRGGPRGLVLVPTRELAGQVRDVLAPLAAAGGLRIAAVFGGTPMERQIKVLLRGADIVVATPGRLIDLAERRVVSLASVRTLVLDEADRMVDMGFMPQVEWLLRRVTGEHQTLLFSATLGAEVDRLVRHYANQPVHHSVVSDQPTVESMEHRLVKVHEMDKVKVAAALAQAASRALLFVRTKRGADRTVRRLRTEGVAAGVLHGGLTQSARQRALAQFRDGRVRLLVATDVAARGLDVDGVDVVIHYDPPEDHKAYLHRSGRTARAGEGGVAVSLVLWDQVVEAERLCLRLGIRQPLVEMFSNDPRLADLTSQAWPATELATGTEGAARPARTSPRRPRGGRGRRRP
jgi:superfamily II DNA/RNA helicase